VVVTLLRLPQLLQRQSGEGDPIERVVVVVVGSSRVVVVVVVVVVVGLRSDQASCGPGQGISVGPLKEGDDVISGRLVVGPQGEGDVISCGPA